MCCGKDVTVRIERMQRILEHRAVKLLTMALICAYCVAFSVYNSSREEDDILNVVVSVLLGVFVLELLLKGLFEYGVRVLVLLMPVFQLLRLGVYFGNHGGIVRRFSPWRFR